MREISLVFSDRDIIECKYLADLGEDGEFVFTNSISYDGTFARGEGVILKDGKAFPAHIIIQIEGPVPISEIVEENWTAGDLLSLGWFSYDVHMKT